VAVWRAFLTPETGGQVLPGRVEVLHISREM